MNQLVEETSLLAARLPELLWRLKRTRIPLSSSVLPMGLFAKPFYSSPELCVNEIQTELYELNRQSNEYSIRYLSERIVRKINVLVHLCQLKKLPQDAAKSFSIETIATRQQWLKTLESEISELEKQQQTLSQQLIRFEDRNNIPQALSLRAELGEIEQQLTKAKESWQHMVYTIG